MSRMNWDRVRRENQMTHEDIGGPKMSVRKASFRGTCVLCKRPIRPGQRIRPLKARATWVHVICGA